MIAPTGIIEAWNGPGRRDGSLTEVRPQDNALHPNSSMLAFEHWYFDAYLDSGHTVVGFLIKRRPEDLPNSRPWVELIVYAPDGTRRQVARKYSRSDATFSSDRCDVRIGPNTARVEFPAAGFPIHHLHIEVDDVAATLRFENETPSWMPGRGETRFGQKDSFGWVVAAPRARVTGSVRIGGMEFAASGRGYADHNWGVGDMKRVIDRWHWGRLYVEDYALLYATVLTQERYGSHQISPLMLAVNETIVLSTGEVQLTEGPAVFDETANRSYPSWIRLQVPDAVDLLLTVRDVIHAHDLLDDVPVVRSRVVKPLVRRIVGHPGYFRFDSDFELTVVRDGETVRRSGRTLHELVALR
ncbi:hypothetical protein FOS14_06135 [Skermania sp. ID1734]|uniref:lipocalin-like domain-containing protein n=1 Tax=Skermania sp. ID1734 TaxID=2597516 RepID=UPI00117F060D|nr:lipocalin-like domain-containing protein [Skermania sp. ID1734]TSE00615.1 hypothetical protein FOS14_06135 [Skermania sp. ID1734]